MRKVTALFAAAVAPLAVACGADPPVVCGDAIPQQQVFVNEQKTIDVCFEDPGGLEYEVAAVSSNTDVVGTLLRGNSVGIAGVAPGEATVTATATNTENLSAETSFSVLVPNRAPNFVSTLEEASVVINKSLTWNLMEFFVEPDGQEMTFSVGSANGSAVLVTLDGSSAVVTGLSEGTSQVTLTAADPDGLQGEGAIEVTVKVPVTLFEDDFEDEETLDDWDRPDTMEASIEDGLLRLRYPEEDFFSWAFQEYDEITDFTVEVTLAPVPGDGGLTGVVWYTGLDAGIIQYFFLTGELANGQNWIFAERDLADGLNVLGGGTSNDVEFDEFADFTISVGGENVRITVGGDELMNETIQGLLTTSVATGLTGGNLASEYDYARLSGVFSGGRSADAPKISLPKADRIDIRELGLPIKR